MAERVLTPSQLNREAAEHLRHLFGMIWLEGEISNFTAARSGHWYFTLKDDQAQVRCAMFANRNRLSRIQPENGMLVQIRAQVSLYEARGEFQLIAEQLREAGIGALHRRYEALKKKLQAEGLFEPERKQPIPPFPRHIVVITSAKGAALQDVRQTLQRRWPQVRLTLIDTLVQGEQAAGQIVNALQQADQLAADTLLLVRGGGSLEDLWAFNEEPVVRAIHALRTPVIAAIGHETDTTLAELAADLRAATPTAAAEQATPDRHTLLRQLGQQQQRLQQALQGQLQQRQLHVDHLEKRLQQAHPARRLQQQRLQLQHLRQSLQQHMHQRQHHAHHQLQQLTQRLQRQHPALRLERLRHRLVENRQRLQQQGRKILDQRQQTFQQQLQKLNLLNPLHTLERGYSITRDQQGHAVQDIHSIETGDLLTTRVQNGEIQSRVIDKTPLTQPRLHTPVNKR